MCNKKICLISFQNQLRQPAPAGINQYVCPKTLHQNQVWDVKSLIRGEFDNEKWHLKMRGGHSGGVDGRWYKKLTANHKIKTHISRTVRSRKITWVFKLLAADLSRWEVDGRTEGSMANWSCSDPKIQEQITKSKQKTVASLRALSSWLEKTGGELGGGGWGFGGIDGAGWFASGRQVQTEPRQLLQLQTSGSAVVFHRQSARPGPTVVSALSRRRQAGTGHSG